MVGPCTQEGAPAAELTRSKRVGHVVGPNAPRCQEGHEGADDDHPLHLRPVAMRTHPVVSCKKAGQCGGYGVRSKQPPGELEVLVETPS